MADRPHNGAGGAFSPNQPYKTFYFVLILATVFTVRDIFLSENSTGGEGGRGKMSSESGSESDGGMGDEGLRQRRFDNEPRPDSSAGLKLSAGSKLSAGKLGGPVMKFMYCTS